jgi:hypothetical protein
MAGSCATSFRVNVDAEKAADDFVVVPLPVGALKYAATVAPEMARTMTQQAARNLVAASCFRVVAVVTMGQANHLLVFVSWQAARNSVAARCFRVVVQTMGRANHLLVFVSWYSRHTILAVMAGERFVASSHPVLSMSRWVPATCPPAAGTEQSQATHAPLAPSYHFVDGIYQFRHASRGVDQDPRGRNQ